MDESTLVVEVGRVGGKGVQTVEVDREGGRKCLLAGF